MSQDELLAWFMARGGCVRVYEIEDQLQLFATDPTPMTKLVESDTDCFRIGDRKAVCLLAIPRFASEPRPALGS